MSEQSVPLEALHRAFRIWGESKGTDPRPFLALVADDVDWRSASEAGHVGKGLSFTGQRNGRAAVDAYFSELAENWQMEHWTVDDILTDGGAAVVLGHCGWYANATGRLVSTQIAIVLRFRDGKIISFREFFDTAAAAEAMFPVD